MMKKEIKQKLGHVLSMLSPNLPFLVLREGYPGLELLPLLDLLLKSDLAGGKSLFLRVDVHFWETVRESPRVVELCRVELTGPIVKLLRRVNAV